MLVMWRPTTGTTLSFAMQQAWNWHFDQDFLEFMGVHLLSRMTLPNLAPAVLTALEMRRNALNPEHRGKRPGLWNTYCLHFFRPPAAGWAALDAQWHTHTWPDMVLRDLGYQLPAWYACCSEMDAYALLLARYTRWHDRSEAFRAAARPARVVELLLGASKQLSVLLEDKVDVHDIILRLAAAGLWAEWHVDPATRLPGLCF
jgi:hypothetical protein